MTLRFFFHEQIIAFLIVCNIVQINPGFTAMNDRQCPHFLPQGCANICTWLTKATTLGLPANLLISSFHLVWERYIFNKMVVKYIRSWSWISGQYHFSWWPWLTLRCRPRIPETRCSFWCPDRVTQSRLASASLKWQSSLKERTEQWPPSQS